MNNRSIPNATVIPVLRYPDVPAAVAWLCGAFGFVERLRIGTHRVQLVFDGGALVVADSGPAIPHEVIDHSVMVRVPEVDAHCDRARAMGARITQEPTTHPFGERQYSVVDIGGHNWTFTQSVADVDPQTWGGVLVPEPGSA
jgi:uncharacterized glyoxalase superfamily protein PhnB